LTASLQFADARVALRVEWSKLFARFDRAFEEVVLASEEMRRNIDYGRESRASWQRLAKAQAHEDAATLEGRRGYALEHARYEQELEAALVRTWTPVLIEAQKEGMFAPRLVDALAATRAPSLANMPGQSTAPAPSGIDADVRLIIALTETVRLSQCDAEREY
jgi:hypothetical protein